MASTGNYDVLIHRIDQFIRKYYLNKLLRGLIFLGAGLFSAYVVITLSEYFGNFNTLVRTLLFYFFIVLNTGLLVWLVVPPAMAWFRLGKIISHDEAAAIIGQHFNDINDKLLNTLQLRKLAGSDPRQRELIEAGINQKIEQLKPVSFPAAVNIKQNNRHLKWILIPAAIICIIAFAAPSILTESTKRLIKHNTYFAPIAPFQFVVTNKSLSAVQGDDLAIEVKLQGNSLPADVYIQTAGNTFKLDKENISRFKYQFSNLQQNTTFTLSANGFTSQPYTISVNLKPLLLHFDATLTYPAYLHKKNETVINAADLTIPAGTEVKWTLHTQNATAIKFSIDEKEHDLTSSGKNMFEYSERINHNVNYTIKPESDQATAGASTYHISTIADEAPSITVQEKTDSVSNNALYFNGAIADDHGFSSLVFHYSSTPNGGGSARSFTNAVKADLSKNQSNFFYFWDLKALGIKPGETVSYYFEVADNDEVMGPKKARSPERTLNVPTEKDLNNQLNTQSQQVKQKIESAVKMAGQVERDAQKLNQSLLNKNAISFDEKKQIQDLLQKRKELEDLVKDIQADNKKNDYNRQENQQQSQQMTEKQKQMEDLLNKLLDKKTQDMLQKLQDMMQQNAKDGAQDQLQQMQSDNKSLKKELDRMLELYKKLDVQQKVDQAVKQLNDLADKQQKLSDQTQQNNSNDLKNQQQQQQQLNQDFKDLKKSLKDIQNANEQLEHKTDFQNPEKDEQDIDQDMNNSSDQLQKGQSKPASQSQKSAAQKMQQMAQKMQQQSQEGEEQQNNIDIHQLRELLKNLVNSSFDQEKTMVTLKSTNPNDPNYITLTQKQKDIKDNLKTAEDSLYSLSKRVPQIQSTVNQEVAAINSHIDKALDDLGDRRTPEANREQQYAMTSMNNLALMLSEALQQLQKAMQNNQGNGSKKPSVSKLAKMQQQLNQNMQKMRDQMQQQGQSMSKSQHQQMSEQLARMARQQQEIRQALEQINRDDNKDGKNGLGNLDKISKQMEQTENDLVNRKITDEALKRQQQIQSRLLEAEKAEQQREQDQQRESNAGKEMPPGYIKALQDYQQLRAKQTEQVKTVSPALNLYYKQKIKSYFDQLNAK